VGERIYKPPVITNGPIRIVPLGAFGEVGRSAVLVDTGESKVLLDVGLKAEANTITEEFPAFHALDFSTRGVRRSHNWARTHGPSRSFTVSF